MCSKKKHLPRIQARQKKLCELGCFSVNTCGSWVCQGQTLVFLGARVQKSHQPVTYT